MIPNVNLGVGEMEFMFCDLHISLNNSLLRDMNSNFKNIFALFDFGFARRHIRF